MIYTYSWHCLTSELWFISWVRCSKKLLFLSFVLPLSWKYVYACARAHTHTHTYTQFTSFLANVFGIIFKNLVLKLRLWSFTLMFSSKGFMVLVLIFRSLILFELNFVCGVRLGSNLILLHVKFQLSQHQLLKRQFFFHWIDLAPLSKINWP